MIPFSRVRRLAAGLAACLVLAGCAASLVRTAVPINLAEEVDVTGAPQVRHWGDAPIPDIEKLSRVRLEQVRASRPESLRDINRPISFLAISGGGADGAFGAGLLNGWSASPNRPVFEVVTGVSAGALAAPFAFLGSRYDRQLEQVFTAYTTKDLLSPELLSGLTGGSAVSSSEPLQRLIKAYMSPEVIGAIAAEHRKGRRLYVGTTNLDSERSVVWDMGAIAALNTKASQRLFRRVLLASVSIPGAFPPVFIDVEIGAQRFQEMHVDGGTTDNAFLLPTGYNLRRNVGTNGASRKIQFFIIANSKMAPSPDAVKSTAFAIAGRSISTLIKQQLEGDLLKIYLAAKKNRVDFRLATIPTTFNETSDEVFDRKYMKKLYDLGYKYGQSDAPWKDRPPGS